MDRPTEKKGVEEDGEQMEPAFKGHLRMFVWSYVAIPHMGVDYVTMLLSD